MRKPAARGFAAGLLLALIAEQTVLFAVPLMIYQDSRDVRFSGLAFALEWIPALLAYPFAGLLADTFGGRRLFIGANVLRAACVALAWLGCSAAPHMAVAILMTNGVLLSVLIAPSRMAVEKTVPAVAANGELAPVQSQVQNMELLSLAAGPALAAALSRYTGKLALLGLASAALLCAAACWRNVPRVAPERTMPLTRGRIGADLMLGFTLLMHNRPVRLLAALNFTINFAFAAALSANAFVITGLFHAPETMFGLMNAGAGALGLVNLLLIPHLLRHVPVDRLGAGGFALLCAGLAAMGLSQGPGVYVSAWLIAMAGVACFNVFNRTRRVKAIAPEHLGKVMGPFYLLNLLSYPLGGLLVAGVAHAFDVRWLMLAFAFLLALPGAALLALTIRRFNESTPAVAAMSAPAVPEKAL
ncbi:MFS transporter [Burkholderia territorii]|uniref:MFS transporter n=1 Tax=Burkholderia territorii TaxID=1503055 RepID=A0A6L3NNH0_9BURK|nr:MFS transporter [Burkholderia territorii]KAB0686474.1 MFS transporter [Burkholderia territorii]MBM2775684.1 MFS transporter [Burkholderia territorii]VWB70003.1 major facilitator transporter [Burkholderia territorii]